jgi:hypothetical protein
VAMKSRCNDPNSQAYDRYGGRGIKVCERWNESFEAFLADVGIAPSPDLSLDRWPNNDGGYEPGNVRWATASQQTANTRMTEKRRAANQRIAASKGISKYGVCLSEAARAAGLNKSTIMARLRYGWTLEEALNAQVQNHRRPAARP